MKAIVKTQSPVWADFPTIFDSFLNDWTQGSAMKVPTPAVNVRETETSFELEVAAPGYRKEDFKVEVEHDKLKISTERKQEQQEGAGKYTRREFSYQSFTRTFGLPEDTMETANITAKYEAGILNISIPKKNEVQAKVMKTIEVA